MKFLTVLLATLCAFFFPIQGLLITVGIAIALDTFTGIFKSVKLRGWRSIRSRRLSDVAGKVVLYNTAVLSIYVMDYHLLAEFFKIWFSVSFFFTKIITIVLVVIELTSIKENFEEAFKIKLWPMLKKLVTRGKEIKNDINEITNI